MNRVALRFKSKAQCEQHYFEVYVETKGEPTPLWRQEQQQLLLLQNFLKEHERRVQQKQQKLEREEAGEASVSAEKKTDALVKDASSTLPVAKESHTSATAAAAHSTPQPLSESAAVSTPQPDQRDAVSSSVAEEERESEVKSSATAAARASAPVAAEASSSPSEEAARCPAASSSEVCSDDEALLKELDAAVQPLSLNASIIWGDAQSREGSSCEQRPFVGQSSFPGGFSSGFSPRPPGSQQGAAAETAGASASAAAVWSSPLLSLQRQAASWHPSWIPGPIAPQPHHHSIHG